MLGKQPIQNTKLLRIILLALFCVTTSVTWAAGGEEGESFNPWRADQSPYQGLARLGNRPWDRSASPSHSLHREGLKFFSSADFFDDHHNPVSHEGYVMDHDHIMAEDGSHVIDFSITKNVLFLFINAGLMLLIFFSVAIGYKRRQGKAPKGIQSFFEPIIIFVRDEIVKPNIGEKKYERYLPYLLTLFFFVLVWKSIGLLPGAANLTGNIAVTMVLAVGTFLLTNLSGNKHYWGHIFNTPGVPFALKPIIVPVEIIGLFTKPISLMVRLFVAITAGHIVLLSLLSLTFIFHSYIVGVGTTIVVVVITFIEILVATIQAYVFTMFSSMYIGMAIDDHH